MDKPKILILGHAEHGKTSVAEILREYYGYGFMDSSYYLCEESIFPNWGANKYNTVLDCYADRRNPANREIWFNMIGAYNTPDLTRTAYEMLALENIDMYVGMRRQEEYAACLAAKIFDHIIWVDASKRKKPESTESMTILKGKEMLILDNNGTREELVVNLEAIMRKVESKETTWFDKPEGAVQVLDHGFFIVNGVSGDDTTIANAARMSYGRGTKKVNNDAGLLNYLVRNYHTSPLEMGSITFHMRLPIFVMRQLVRHRTAKLNEYSGRYSEMVRLFYVPDLDQIKLQDSVNKQGSAEPLPIESAKLAQRTILKGSEEAFDDYEKLLATGVSRETARIVLPLNTYTEVVFQMDVSNLIKLLRLRDDDHAQHEIHVYAKLMSEALKRFFPKTYAAYENTKKSITLTPAQIEYLVSGGKANNIKSTSELVQVEKLYTKSI